MIITTTFVKNTFLTFFLKFVDSLYAGANCDLAALTCQICVFLKKENTVEVLFVTTLVSDQKEKLAPKMQVYQNFSSLHSLHISHLHQ